MSFQLPPNADLSTIPAGMPPPGVTPNFGHPSGTLQPDIIGVGVVMLIMACVLVSMATVNRIRKLTAPDYVRLVGLLLTIPYVSTILALSKNAVHQWDFPLSWYNDPHNLVLLYVQTVFLGPSIFFSKLSILLLYFEVFQVKKVTRWLTFGGIFLDTITYWPELPLVSYFCAPHVGQPWDIKVIANCARTDPWGVVLGTLATLLDLYIFAIPVPIIWKLQMGTRQKVAVSMIFGTAVLGVVASVLGLVYRIQLFKGITSDYNWVENQLFICIMVEDCVALFVSSMPAASGQAKEMLRGYLNIWSHVSSKKSTAHTKIPDYSDTSVRREHNNIEFQRLNSRDASFQSHAFGRTETYAENV